MSYRKVHKESRFDPKKIHTCRAIREVEGIHIIYHDSHGWLLVYDTVKVAGHEGCSYATGIKYCPHCGERLE